MSSNTPLTGLESALDSDQRSEEEYEIVEATQFIMNNVEQAESAVVTESATHFRQQRDAPETEAPAASPPASTTAHSGSGRYPLHRDRRQRIQQIELNEERARITMNRREFRNAIRQIPEYANSCLHHNEWVRYSGPRWCEDVYDGERCQCNVNTIKPSGKKMTMWTCGKCKAVVACERHKRFATDHSRVHHLRGKKTGL